MKGHLIAILLCAVALVGGCQGEAVPLQGNAQPQKQEVQVRDQVNGPVFWDVKSFGFIFGDEVFPNRGCSEFDYTTVRNGNDETCRMLMCQGGREGYLATLWCSSDPLVGDSEK